MLKRPLTVQPFTLTASSQMSAKVGTETYRVRVAVTALPSTAVITGAFILFGDSTALTATSTNSSLLPAPWVDEFDVTPGQSFALIEASTAHGTVTVTEMS